jgi:hypothetical protein
VDALIVIYTPVDPTCASETLDAIRNGIAAGARRRARRETDPGMLMAGTSRPQPLVIGGERVPVYAFPENARARWPRSPLTRSGARKRPVSSGASRTSAPTMPGRCAARD